MQSATIRAVDATLEAAGMSAQDYAKAKGICPTDPLLNVDQAARELGVSTRTLARLVEDGSVETVTIRGRKLYRRDTIERLKAEGALDHE
jgi:excisionase family DNA binding protein